VKVLYTHCRQEFSVRKDLGVNGSVLVCSLYSRGSDIVWLTAYTVPVGGHAHCLFISLSQAVLLRCHQNSVCKLFKLLSMVRTLPVQCEIEQS